MVIAVDNYYGRYESSDIRELRRYKSKRRRVKQIQHYKRLFARFVVALVLISFIVGGLFSVRSYATQTNNTKFVKNYKSIMVENGQTLDSLTDLYMCIEFKTRDKFINEVKSINHLKSDTIHAGEFLIIPFYSAAK